ncbi:hypothetical protein EDD21DRAFT_407606, partial [Dissophora ornata]
MSTFNETVLEETSAPPHIRSLAVSSPSPCQESLISLASSFISKSLKEQSRSLSTTQHRAPQSLHSTAISATAATTPKIPAIDTESTINSNKRNGNRQRNSSASTPPPSPPLSATYNTRTSDQEDTPTDPKDRKFGPEIGRRRLRSPSHQITAAAAAAAAASYTSQELAIAYLMVTSSPEHDGQDQEEQSPQVKLCEPKPSTDGSDASDALSSLLKKSSPLQEPYFRTRHSIASQHTLSTLGGELFSLDEVPKEFNEDMYVAMRNRIFELEAKNVHYAPFNRTRKRSLERPVDEYSGHHRRSHVNNYGYGHEIEGGHYLKRQAYHYGAYPQYPSPPALDCTNIYRPSHSYPPGYAPETYRSGLLPKRLYQGRHPYDMDQDCELPGTAESHKDGPRLITPRNPPAIQPRPVRPLVSEGAPQSSCKSHAPYAIHQSQPSHVSQVSQVNTPSKYGELQPSSTLAGNARAAQAAAQQQQRQSFHQRQHRAQQQAQSDYSRSYHLQKHLRMLDQQRAAQVALKQQQQEQQQMQQGLKIQRNYKPHQQMYPHPSFSQPVTIQPRLGAQQKQQQQQQH